MSDQRIFQSVFGISTGDIVTTSYGSGPEEVWSISPPHFVSRSVGHLFVRDYPVICLTLILPGIPPRGDHGLLWINDVRQEGARWLTDANDELFVQPGVTQSLPIDLFRSYPPVPEPYVFDPAVDYEAGQRRVWRCEECKRDFNAVVAGRCGPAYCPHCQKSWCVDEVWVLRLSKRKAVTQ